MVQQLATVVAIVNHSSKKQQSVESSMNRPLVTEKNFKKKEKPYEDSCAESRVL